MINYNLCFSHLHLALTVVAALRRSLKLLPWFRACLPFDVSDDMFRIIDHGTLLNRSSPPWLQERNVVRNCSALQQPQAWPELEFLALWEGSQLWHVRQGRLEYTSRIVGKLPKALNSRASRARISRLGVCAARYVYPASREAALRKLVGANYNMNRVQLRSQADTWPCGPLPSSKLWGTEYVAKNAVYVYVTNL